MQTYFEKFIEHTVYWDCIQCLLEIYKVIMKFFANFVTVFVYNIMKNNQSICSVTR